MEHTERKAYFLSAYDEHADELYRFCLFKVSDPERAQDLVQDVFTSFWQKIRLGEHIEHPRAFLYTTARNRVIDWYRKRKETSLDQLQDEGFDPLGSSGNEIVTRAEHQEALRAIETLDEPSREVILLRYVEGWTPLEIARLTGETPNVISVRLNRAIKRLRTNMQL